jgi:CO dehydrogenase/acetyl-CoA synthase beta subunit
MLRTDNPSLVRDGRITLIGPDVDESSGKSLPFGQVVMMGGVELSDKEHEALQHLTFIGDQIEGYMVRSLSRNLWSRVSNDAAQKGFCFETLGKALMAIYKSNNLKIQAMETIFVTSSKEDVGLLDHIAAQVQKIDKEIVKQNWKIRGYDIDCAFDCSSCTDKPVCDDIREVLRAKKKSDKDGAGSQTLACQQ